MRLLRTAKKQSARVMKLGGSQRRRLLVPEVVQTSAMDCGPAVLKCLLEGFGIPVSYGRLREACQTDVDGTSIDVIEEVAGQLGLMAEQVMVPVDHLLLAEAHALPAILVVRVPSGLTHFVLVWRRHGPLVQVMDPAVGRRWMTCRQLLEEIYVHTQRFSADQWREWAVSDEFRGPLARRLRGLGLGRSSAALIEAAVVAPGWRRLARLDAAIRLVESLVHAGGLRPGREAENALNSFLGGLPGPGPAEVPAIPDACWSIIPAPPEAEGEEQILVRGAVLVRVRGCDPTSRPTVDSGSSKEPKALSRELAAALAEPSSRPGRQLFGQLRGYGWLALAVLGLGLALAAGSVVFEALLLRGVLEIGRELALVEQRLFAVGAFVLFLIVLLVIELRVASGLARLGRWLETRLRVAFLERIPRLHDRYFQSRPISDMAERGHMIQQIRLLPRLAGQFVRAVITLLITASAIIWIDPAQGVIAMSAAILTVLLPLGFLPLLQGLDLRVRTHAGALSRFYLDALLGLAAVRAHTAERAVRREHEGLLVEWARASQGLLRWVVALEGLQILVGFGLAGWLLLLHASRTADAAGALLLAYWALNLPVLGEEIVLLARQYPIHRNVTLRLLEPLGAPEAVGTDHPTSSSDKTVDIRGAMESSPTNHAVASPNPALADSPASARGVAIRFDGVHVRAAGQRILEEIHLCVEPGEHVAIVGASGAGKSSLVGLLLGWHRPAAGQVWVDNEPLDPARLDHLRSEAAWVDPAVQLWNRSLVRNLLYGAPAEARAIGEVLDEADLYEVLRRLPAGLQTTLGEGGGLLSAGEGQRVRLGRALSRAKARLVILDEPFRGLDRDNRRTLLQRCRQLWRDATLLCITHDVSQTSLFERVLVLQAGRAVEDGAPSRLAQDPASHYRALLDAEDSVRTGLWSSAIWRRLRLEAGQLREDTREAVG
jgi:ATP-binding cassette subfamily B protein